MEGQQRPARVSSESVALSYVASRLVSARDSARDAAGRHITATATQIILCGRPHKRDYIHLYRGDGTALAESLGRIQRTAALILTAVETA